MKVQGNINDYTLVSKEENRTIVRYGFEEISATDATWYEVYFYKKKDGIPTFEMARNAILDDIDSQTDEKILNGYEFTPDGEEEPVVVWLSKESQTNFSEAQRLHIVPVKFKLNEDENRQPIYHTFTTTEELDRFYLGGVQYINQCLNEGWQRKDSIDWEPYKEYFPEPEEPVTEQS